MNEINEIKLPEGVDRISVMQHDDRVVIKFIAEKPKFKVGDKVRIKDGISSRTVNGKKPSFMTLMDNYIGTTMTVKGYTNEKSYVVCNESGYMFHEDWLEPWSDEPKKGDLAIFWDNDKDDVIIRLYDKKDHRYHSDSYGMHWENAIKFESKEQFEKILRGEI